jgi:hypothetical protein
VQPREPIGPIQTIPPGLLNLLNLKQMGQNPGVLSDQVDPTVELFAWYMRARAQGAPGLTGQSPPTQVLAIGASPGNFLIGAPNVVVPSNELWYVESMQLFGTLGAAADTMRIACGVEQLSPAPTDIHQVGPDYQDVATARAARRIIARSDQPFWAAPGDAFIMMISDIVLTVAVTMTLSLRATRLQL